MDLRSWKGSSSSWFWGTSSVGCCWWVKCLLFWWLFYILLYLLIRNIITGDTFPVGCAFDESIVHHKVLLSTNFIAESFYFIIIFFPFWFLKACIYNFFMVVQYFKENPDYNNPAFNTKYGAYSEGRGLDNVLMSWGHDDYMYLVKFCKTFYWKIKLCFFYLFQWHYYRGSLYSGS